MRVRVKFAKTDFMKYIGHLDVMRFFQKVLRRAQIDVAYSEGFSPHMLMSFAQPLGVGLTSEGEYFDLDLKSALSSAEMIRRMNEQMPEGMSVSQVVQIPEDKANKCMTLVAAADYTVSFGEGESISEDMRAALQAFFNRESITVTKKTKRKEAVVDIRPLIYQYEIREKEIFLRLSSGSVDNLKPSLVMEAFFKEQGTEAGGKAMHICRNELYARTEGGFAPLYKLGAEIPGGAQ